MTQADIQTYLTNLDQKTFEALLFKVISKRAQKKTLQPRKKVKYSIKPESYFKMMREKIQAEYGIGEPIKSGKEIDEILAQVVIV